jgi:hypothetical protein
MRPLSLLLITLLFVLLDMRMQSSFAQVIKVPADPRMLQFVSELNEQLKAKWLRQPKTLLEKTKDHPIEINYSVNSLCVASDLEILQSSQFPDVDLEALRAVSNIPILNSSRYEPLSAYNLRSTFFGTGVTTDFIGFVLDPGYRSGGDWDLPDMWRAYPERHSSTKEVDK